MKNQPERLGVPVPRGSGPPLGEVTDVATLDHYFLPFEVVATAWIFCLRPLYDGYPLELLIAVLATGIAVWTAHTAAAANERREAAEERLVAADERLKTSNERRELLDTRDRVRAVYLIEAELLTRLGDPEDRLDQLEAMPYLIRLQAAIEGAEGVVDLEAGDLLLAELTLLGAGSPKEKIDLWNRTTAALAEIVELEKSLPRLNPPSAL